MTDPGLHLSDLALDILASDPPGSRPEGPRAEHLASCAACSKRLADFAADRGRAMADPRFAAVRAQVSAGRPAAPAPVGRRSPWIWRMGTAVGFASAALLLGVVLAVRPSVRRGGRSKGSAALEVVAHAPAHPPPFHVGEPVDLEVTSIGDRYALVFAIDERGSVAQLWPTRGTQSGELTSRPLMKLKPSFRVTPGSLRLYALLSNEPIDSALATHLLDAPQPSQPIGTPATGGLPPDAEWVEASMAVEGSGAVKIAALLALLMAGSATAEGRRYALLIGSNRGDPRDEVLHYAESDASRMRETLTDVGGVLDGDAQTLLAPSADDLQRALEEMDARIRAHASLQDQLVIYISGHADEGELHLGGSRLPTHVVIDYLKRSPASVAILIIDSCRSGSATRLKGLVPIEGTQVDIETPEITGRIVIGSSGANELSQESDTLGSSIFTHHLIAALRGAADASRDGVVTLQEAYTYAYALTVESTFATEGGVQHPTFSVDLHGQGDLVLSRLAQARGRVKLHVAAPGEWLVYRLPDREIVVQLEKAAGPATIALPPGDYRLIDRQGSKYREALVQVPTDGEAVVEEGSLKATDYEGLPKGSPDSTFEVGADALVGTGATLPTGTSTGFSVWSAWRRDWLGPINLLAVDLSAQTAWASPSALSVESYREEALDLRLGPGVTRRWGPLEVQLAVEAGWILVRQSQLPGAGPYFGVEPEVGLAPRLQVGIGGPAFIGLGGFGGVEWIRTDNSVEANLRGAAELGVGFSL